MQLNKMRISAVMNSQQSTKIVKPNQIVHYTRHVTPKRAMSGGAYLRGLAPGQHSSEETSQRWQAVSDTLPI